VSDRAAWVSVRVQPGAARDAVVAALFEAGAQGIQEVGDELVTHVATANAADEMRRAVLSASADARVATAPVDPVDWSVRWKEGIRAQDLGAIVITPPWLARGYDEARTVVIEPEMAFGTGEHQTTRGVVRLLASVIRRGDRVADLGAGSAVLAIAAAKLGAAHVAAIEIDPDAIGNADANVRRNGVADRVVVIEGDALTLLPLVAPLHLITANILSSVILDLLPAMASALERGGHVILSGMLTAERDAMLRALETGGWSVVAEDTEDQWWSATIARR
jgi:ribosomal protein L11 methyltransferase